MEKYRRIAEKNNCWLDARGPEYWLEHKKTGRKYLLYTCGRYLPTFSTKDVERICQNLGQPIQPTTGKA